MKEEETLIGYVRQVVGAKVTVEVTKELVPSANPIVQGKMHKIGQVGSFLRIPLGSLNLYGVVSKVGATAITEEIKGMDEEHLEGQRWLEMELAGEAFERQGLQRGVSRFPTIDDRVHIATERDIEIIYESEAEEKIDLGTHVASENLSVSVDLDKLITRHSCIVGSTGSGKSNTVAGLLKKLTNNPFKNSSIVVIDPHGEYKSALSENSKEFSINHPDNPLEIPFWSLPFRELFSFLSGQNNLGDDLQVKTLKKEVLESKKRYCEELDAGSLNTNEVKIDSPIPFDLKKIWYDLFEKENATLWEKEDWDTVAYQEDKNGEPLDGKAEDLVKPQYVPPGSGNTAPFRSKKGNMLNRTLDNIFKRLNNTRYDFLLRPTKYEGKNNDLDSLLRDWLNHGEMITILNLEGVPSEIADLVIGALARILFNATFWGSGLEGIGEDRPLLMVFEEAHDYLPKDTGDNFISGYAKKIVKKIHREGRKYGIGSLIISQRPSDLDPTILSQTGTFISLRLTNSEDQSQIKSTLPDTYSGLVEMLPALRTGEAIIAGEAVKIPCRVGFPLATPRPDSRDPEPSSCWKKERSGDYEYDRSVTRWRHQRRFGISEEE